jgi:hypothetical protein
VNWNGDASAVLAEGAKATGEVAKVGFDAETAALKARADAEAASEKAARERRQGRIDDLRDALGKARTDLAAAQAGYDAIRNDPNAKPEDIAAAKIKRDSAQAIVDELERQLSALRTSSAPAAGDLPQPSPQGGAGEPFRPKRAKQWGLLLFRIVEGADGKSVSLEPVASQKLYDVYLVPKETPPSPPASVPPTALAVIPPNLELQRDVLPKTLGLDFNRDTTKVIGSMLVNLALNQPVDEAQQPKVEWKNSKHVDVTFPAASPSGTFRLNIKVDLPGQTLPGQVDVPVRIQ